MATELNVCTRKQWYALPRVNSNPRQGAAVNQPSAFTSICMFVVFFVIQCHCVGTLPLQKRTKAWPIDIEWNMLALTTCCIYALDYATWHDHHQSVIGPLAWWDSQYRPFGSLLARFVLYWPCFTPIQTVTFNETPSIGFYRMTLCLITVTFSNLTYCLV